MNIRGPDAFFSLPAKVRLLVMLTFALTIGHFVWLTRPARLTNTDDVDQHHAVQNGQFEEFATNFAQAQGRFHFVTAPQLWIIRLHAIRSDLVYAMVRALFFFGQIGLVGWLAARITRQARTGWLVALGLAASLHFPATYFAALGYPTLWLGCTALLVSLHLHLTFLRCGHRLAVGFAGVFFLLSCLMQEIFCVFLPLFILLSIREGQRSAVSLARTNLPYLVVAGAYCATYLCFSRLYPSTYGGTQLSFDLWKMTNVVLRHTVAVLPGYELLAHRTQPMGLGPLLKPAPDLLKAFVATPWLAYGLAILQARTVFALLRLDVPVDRPGLLTIAFTGGIALLPNITIGLTKTHQMLAYFRTYPYAYSFYTFCTLGVVAGFWWEWQASSPASTAVARNRRALAASALCLLLFVSAMVSNHHTVKLMQQWYN